MQKRERPCRAPSIQIRHRDTCPRAQPCSPLPHAIHPTGSINTAHATIPPVYPSVFVMSPTLHYCAQAFHKNLVLLLIIYQREMSRSNTIQHDISLRRNTPTNTFPEKVGVVGVSRYDFAFFPLVHRSMHTYVKSYLLTPTTPTFYFPEIRINTRSSAGGGGGVTWRQRLPPARSPCRHRSSSCWRSSSEPGTWCSGSVPACP